MRDVVCITGASSGIGREFARLYGQTDDLYLIARNEKALQELKQEIEGKYGHRVYLQIIDLTGPDAPERVYEALKSEGLFAETLINNAGFGSYGPFSGEPLEEYRRMIDLNDGALVSLTYLFLKDMKEEKRGKILNVASIVGLFPGPSMAVYSASKAFVLSFSRAIKEEVRKDGITVSCLCPGPVRTNFFKTAGIAQAKILDSGLTHEPQRVAAYGKYLLDHKRSYGVEGFLNKTGAFLVRLLPSPLDAKIIGSVQMMKNKV